MSAAPIRRFVLGAATPLLLLSCAPTREAMRAPVDELTQDRIGQRASVTDDEASRARIDEEVRSLLTGELSAEAAARLALLRNRELQAAYASLGLAEADLVAAGLLPNPSLEAGLHMNALEVGQAGLGIGLGVEQDVLALVRMPMRVGAARASLDAARARVARQAIESAAAARAGFYRVVAMRELVRLRRTVAEAAEAAYDLAKRLSEAGNLSAYDRLQEEARYREALLALADAERALALERERLNETLGLYGNETTWRVPARLPEPLTEALVSAEIEHRVVEASLELAALRAELDTAAQRLGYESATRFTPALHLGVEVEAEGLAKSGAVGHDGGHESAPRVTPSVGIALPIFDQGQARVLASGSVLHRAGDLLAARAIKLRARARARAAVAQADANERRARYLREVVLPLRTAALDDDTARGWYPAPEGTQARRATPAELAADGIEG